MNGTFRLAARYFRKGGRRTVINILSTILAVLLVAGTSLLVLSTVDIQNQKSLNQYGRWQAKVSGLNAKQAETLIHNVRFSSSGLVGSIGNYYSGKVEPRKVYYSGYGGNIDGGFGYTGFDDPDYVKAYVGKLEETYVKVKESLQGTVKDTETYWPYYEPIMYTAYYLDEGARDLLGITFEGKWPEKEGEMLFLSDALYQETDIKTLYKTGDSMSIDALEKLELANPLIMSPNAIENGDLVWSYDKEISKPQYRYGRVTYNNNIKNEEWTDSLTSPATSKFWAEREEVKLPYDWWHNGYKTAYQSTPVKINGSFTGGYLPVYRGIDFNTGTQTDTIIMHTDKMPDSLTVYLSTPPGKNIEDELNQALLEAGIKGVTPIYNTNLAEAIGYDGMRNMNEARSRILLVSLLSLLVMAFVLSNSFSMFIKERIAHFGLLRCAGASNSQITRIVLTEGFFTALIAIPLGLILSYAVAWIQFLYLKSIGSSLFQTIRMQAHIEVILAAAAAIFIVVLLSVFVPVILAGRTSPIVAVQGQSLLARIRSKKAFAPFGRRFITPLLAPRNITKGFGRFFAVVLSIAICLGLSVSIISYTTYFSKQYYSETQNAAIDYKLSWPENKTYGNQSDIAYKVSREQIFAARQELLDSGFFNGVHVDDDSTWSISSTEGRFGDEILLSQYVRDNPEPFYVYHDGVYSYMFNVKRIDEQDYNTMSFIGEHESYDTLVAEKHVIVDQTLEAVDINLPLKELSPELYMPDYQNINYADQKVGDIYNGEIEINKLAEVAPGTEPQELYDGELVPTEYSDLELNWEVGAVLAPYEPWFDEYQYMNVMLYMPAELYDEVFPYSGKEFYLLASINKTSAIEAETLVEEVCRKYGLDFERVNQAALDASTLEEAKKSELYIFMAIVMMICVIHIYNVLMAMVLGRRKQIAMLKACGMSFGQILRSLFVEIFTAVTLGCAMGIGAAYGGLMLFEKLLLSGHLSGISYIFSVTVDMVKLPLIITACLAFFASFIPLIILAGTNILKTIREKQ